MSVLGCKKQQVSRLYESV